MVVDPASNWPLFAEKARELISVNGVDAIFGCWTSVSRKSVLPVIEELNGLLFYPVQYEGEESSKNVIYTGAAPNQQAIPAVDYMAGELGVEKWALLGTDYVYPRTTNNILDAYLKDKGVAEGDIFVNYTPFGHSDWSKIVADVVALAEDPLEVAVQIFHVRSGRIRGQRGWVAEKDAEDLPELVEHLLQQVYGGEGGEGVPREVLVPVLPADADGRQRVRALAAIVGCDIHPINNRRILEYLHKTFGADEAAAEYFDLSFDTEITNAITVMPIAIYI